MGKRRTAMEQIAIVTGGTGGIGLATAQALGQAGVKVYTLSRKPGGDSTFAHLCADVSDEGQVRRAVEEVLSREGKIDLLVNCAGFGISGAVEFTHSADAHRQMEVNLFGTDNLCRAILPVMRRPGKGRIVNVSSMAAPLPIPFQAWYSVSKAAINAYTGALINEVRPYGVSLCAVMPGDIRTGFTAARKKSDAGDDAYGGRIARSVARMERDEKHGMDPAAAGRAIARIALKRRVKPLYAIGGEYKLFALLAKLLPCGAVSRILGRMYAGK